MKKNSKKQIGTTKRNHPGRPRYEMQFPTRKEWTFTDLMGANGVETDPTSKQYGKGDKCTMLTLRKNIEADMYSHKPGKPLVAKNRTRVNPHSQVVLIPNVTAEPESENGLGRRALLYCLRVNKDSVLATPRKAITSKVAKTPRKVKTTAITSQTPTADVLDQIHKDLATPTPVLAPETPPVLTVPVVSITPDPIPVEVPVSITPEPTPAPEAIAAETAVVAVEATAAVS
jgi:hypothetical protein